MFADCTFISTNDIPREIGKIVVFGHKIYSSAIYVGVKNRNTWEMKSKVVLCCPAHLLAPLPAYSETFQFCIFSAIFQKNYAEKNRFFKNIFCSRKVLAKPLKLKNIVLWGVFSKNYTANRPFHSELGPKNTEQTNKQTELHKLS